MALSGGTVISGDRLYALPDAKLAILKQILPVYGEAARPLDLPPASGAVVAIRPAADHPLLVGTDRHVLQGAVELAALRWEGEQERRTGRLSGTLNAIAGSRPTLTIAVPERFRPARATIDGRPIPPGDSRDGLLRCNLPATRTGPQDWSIEFE
jgi:hypothetical protein